MAVKKKTMKKPVVKKKKAAAKNTSKKSPAKKKRAVRKAPAKKKEAALKNAVRKPAVRILRRSEKNKMLAGVCGGIGKYFGIDPNIVRLVWIAVSLVGGIWSIITSIVVYAIAALVMPKE